MKATPSRQPDHRPDGAGRIPTGFRDVRNLVEAGWSGIDVQLKRRAHLISNLLSRKDAAVADGLSAGEKRLVSVLLKQEPVLGAVAGAEAVGEGATVSKRLWKRCGCSGTWKLLGDPWLFLRR
ncbi:LemA family protein [Desulfoglaeba alkanexedens ALDC]|uniref:LemA family protein n=1 Tax=Desulfoglaeba alkanexedens ALDC TaxID=980445 RepID=A0A4P8L602_9BACT|nr:LemA family protein [Desulfoglaeba alkanexedens ALDC]